ncbi:MAG TPA: FAD-binding oxidoreductase [Steroidobacteraceae bacterium]|jgi:FAD/FMN-containing dehydrogenase
MALSAGFVESIGREFPVNFASSDPSDLATYGRDWAGAFAPRASIVCRPRTTDEVSRLMKLCAQHRVPVVPSGGRTGLACGALATCGELILSLERMQRMEPVDSLGRTLRVQAGAVIESVRRHCTQAGLLWPIDLHSTGSQIGGIIATNAGGMRVVRYGLTRRWVLGLTVVLANGDVLQLNDALEKSSAGVDLRQLFIESEGILGIITEATLKLTRPAGKVDVLLLAVPSFEAVLQIFERARNASFTLMAFESFTHRCLAHVIRHHQLPPAFEVPANHYALLEVTQGEDAIDEWLASLHAANLVTTARVAQNAHESEQLWAYRTDIDSSLSDAGLIHRHNLALPLSRLATFYDELETLHASGYSDCELCLFAHVGEGTVQVRLIKPDAQDKRSFLARCSAFDAAMFDLLVAHQGGASAEHGIGLLKKALLVKTRSAAEIDLMRTLKRAMDPLGLLNPGKVL